MDSTPPRRLAQPQGGSSAAFEFVAAPVLLALFGLWLDRSVFGTTPLITVFLSVLGVVGATIKLYYGYRVKMEELEQSAAWSRREPGEAA